MGVLSAPEGRQLLYHYTNAGSAFEILRSRQLLMNPYSKMGDPLESLEIPRLVRYRDEQSPDGRLPIEDARLMLGDLRDMMRILSLTSDATGYEEPEEVPFGKGYARPRMWEAYGENHYGVCLALDGESILNGPVREHLQGMGGTNVGPVMYSPTGFIGDRACVLPDIPDDERATAALFEHLTDHNEAFWFLKLCDWETEFEYRLVLFPEMEGDGRTFVSIERALKAVVVGTRMSEAKQFEVRELCMELRVPTYRLVWASGRPAVEPLTDGQA